MELKDYLHLYLGCLVEIQTVRHTKYGVEKDSRKGTFIGFADYHRLEARIAFRAGPEGRVSTFFLKPILRPLSDMTAEEANYFAWLCMDSKFHLDKDCRVSQEEIDTEIQKNDGGNFLNKDIEIYIQVTIRCFEGAVVIRKDGSICVEDDEGVKQNPLDQVAEKIRFLLSKHFDLFGLIKSGLAVDSATLKETIK